MAGSKKLRVKLTAEENFLVQNVAGKLNISAETFLKQCLALVIQQLRERAAGATKSPEGGSDGK